MKGFIKFAIIATLFSLPAIAQKPDSSVKPEGKPSPVVVKLPTAKDVVEKYVKAVGGREAWSKTTTRLTTGTMELSPMGLKGTIASYARSDGRSYTKVSIAGLGDIIDGYDGTTAWTVNPIQGNRVKEGKELLQTRRTNAFGWEPDITKIYTTLTVRGTEKVGDRDTYVIVASTEGLPDDILYFDIETGLMLRTDSVIVTPEGNQAMSSLLDDYRVVDGVKSPFKIKAKTPAFEINTVLTEIKYGVAIEDSKFAQPK